MRRGDGRCSRLHGQGAIHPGHLPAQLPVGPRPSTRPGEPRVAGPGLGAGPGNAPFTIDLDSTIYETYGLTKEGARHHGYTGKRGYHPLLAVAAGTGEVLMSRLREGRANTARGATHFLRETLGRVRYAGARGQLTVRVDSGFYTHGVVSVCRKMDVRFSITIRQHKSLRHLIEAIPETADGVAARATTASFAWLHSRRSPVPTLTAAPTPSATTAMTSLRPFAASSGRVYCGWV